MRPEDAAAIAHLEAFIRQHGLVITTAAAHPELGGASAIDLIISTPKQGDWRVTVLDEYGDARSDNPPLCLALLDMAFRELGDAEGQTNRWAIAEGLDPAAAATQVTFARNETARAAFLAAYGPIPDAVTDLDWQLNAGLAQALRALQA